MIKHSVKNELIHLSIDNLDFSYRIPLIKLGKAIIKKYPLTILFTSISFIVIWCLVIFRVYDKITGTSALVDTSWFQILNPVFIISLAPLYSKFWEKYNAF